MYGPKIKLLRELSGKTEQTVAKEAGLDQSKYSRIENNQPVKVEEELLERIAKVLHVGLSDIKNPMPVVNHNPKLLENTIANPVANEFLKELICQLHTKDTQINKLLEIITPPPEKILNSRS